MNINWGGPGYAEYQGWMKVSGGEKTVANAQAADSQYLQNMMQMQFAEQDILLNHVLIPQLTQWAQHPPGFGLQALSAMKSQALDTIGGQLKAQQQNLQSQFATQNMAGLGSGVQAALGANLAQGAAGQSASALQQIAIAQGQEQVAQQQYGMQGLGQASQLLGQAPQSAGLLGQSLGQQFNEQYTMSQQGGFWSNLARGVLGSMNLGGALGLIPGIGGTLSTIFGGATGGGGSQQQAPTSQPYSSFGGVMGQPYYANQPPSPLALPAGSFGQAPGF